MKRILLYLSMLVFLGFLGTTATSCKTGYGCPAEEEYKKKQDKPLSTKRGKSKLFKKS